MLRYLKTGLAVLMTSLAGAAHGQLTVELTAPASTPNDATVYIAGTFNGWDPGNSAYALTPGVDNVHVITLPDSVRGYIEFKFTLGTWESVEQSAQGFDVPNRSTSVPATGAATYTGSVATWRNIDTWPLPNSTATDGVSILDFDFELPQLNRTRRIWIYLPPDYSDTDKRYPVIYMQDGQNVFDVATSFLGEWEVDETLDELHATGDWGAIVVAIANGEGDRANEYHPWPGEYGGGQGDLYVDFLVDTLKPYIDANYRTLANARNTAVGGSSSAGLLAFYAGTREPGSFGRVLAFSSAFFANPEVYDFVAGGGPAPEPVRYSMISGENETVGSLSPGVFADAQLDMVNTMAEAGYDVGGDVQSVLPPDGAHAEWFWAREFSTAYSFLYDRNLDSDGDAVPDYADNCIVAVNSDQRDTNGDGYGNACDGDIDNDGHTNFADLVLFQDRFYTTDADTDLDGDGFVNFIDLSILSDLFFLAPGPSGAAP